MPPTTSTIPNERTSTPDHTRLRTSDSTKKIPFPQYIPPLSWVLLASLALAAAQTTSPGHRGEGAVRSGSAV